MGNRPWGRSKRRLPYYKKTYTKNWSTSIKFTLAHSFLGPSSGKVFENENIGLLEIKCPFSVKGRNITQYEISKILELHDGQFCLETT